VRARIIHIDHFGNCVTNITREMVQSEQSASLVINRKTIRKFRNFYDDDSTNTPFAIWGSASFLEMSVNGGSAARVLRAKRNDVVTLRKSL
jgi:S-adenosyl-L-methionine hydrolase (adenosine-forming)